MLILVPTPIGNLADITLRALDVLKTADVILCEDTKVTLKLLNHYAIQTPLESYHQFTEKKKLQQILLQLEKGHTLALVSDAGTPGICDPGALLVEACFKKGIPVTALPGASALVVAISLSSHVKEAIQFLGFVPKNRSERNVFLKRMLQFDGLSYAYETPHQIKKTLEELKPFNPECALFRELTKRYEDIQFATPDILLKNLTLKGEFVLMVKGNLERKEMFEEDHLFHLFTQKHKLSSLQAIKLMADLLQVSKKKLYQKYIICS